jgi:tRNA (mo5U34)-methyltransferase
MNRDQIREKIATFPRWHYEFDLKGELTPVANPSEPGRHRARRDFFFKPLLDLYDGSLAGKRVLDLGCNAGFWSLCAAQARCDYVLGIDGRTTHVEQARFVFEANEIDPARFDFVMAEVERLDLERFGKFDIVLCLGLLHHLRDPLGLLDQIRAINTDVLLIDTLVSRIPGRCFEIRYDDPEDPRKAIGRHLVLTPTKRAIATAARDAGYDVALLKASPIGPAGLRDYSLGFRRVFFCSQRANLSRLNRPLQELGVKSHLFDSAAWLGQALIRLATGPKRP